MSHAQMIMANALELSLAALALSLEHYVLHVVNLAPMFTLECKQMAYLIIVMHLQ